MNRDQGTFFLALAAGVPIGIALMFVIAGIAPLEFSPVGFAVACFAAIVLAVVVWWRTR